MADQGQSDIKLIQYLNEAYGKEKELEVALQAHIAMTTRPPYKKRLQQHLKETKAHARAVERRIKQLGGKAEWAPVPGPDAVGEAASKVAEVASKGLSAAKGQLHVLRGTGEAEKMLKNAKTEYWNEFEEIATYYAIETLADAVGDKETHRLARSIRKEEERMARFLEKQIPTLTKAVVQEEIPAAERRAGGSPSRSRRASTSRNGSASRRKPAASSSRKPASSSSRKPAASSTRKPAASRSRSNGSSRARRTTKSSSSRSS
jgi:ferritin-like metal-binding protein YciE